MSTFVYTSNASIERLAERVRQASRILVTTHAKPDGDALGSTLGVVRAARALGKHVEGWLVGPFDPSLLSLAGSTPLTLVDPKRPFLPGAAFDLVVVVDTGARSQLETIGPWLFERADITVGLDHHARGDAIANERVIDVECGAAAMLVGRLVDALQIPFETGGHAGGRESIAEALFLGLATDTGWFRFQNAKPPEFELASRLLAAGVDKDRLLEITENSHRPERLAIEGRALAKVRFVADGAVAMTSLSLADFQESGATLEETAGIVNIPMSVGRVRAAVLLTETEPGLVKISFRSKPSVDGARFFNVNEIAATFGGGGHVHAAGARLKTSLAEAERAVIAVLT